MEAEKRVGGLLSEEHTSTKLMPAKKFSRMKWMPQFACPWRRLLLQILEGATSAVVLLAPHTVGALIAELLHLFTMAGAARKILAFLLHDTPIKF